MTGIWIGVGVLIAGFFGFFVVRQQVSSRVNARMTFVQRREGRLLEVTTAISEELQLRPLLLKIIEAVCEILSADRATLFLFDDHSDELWSDVALGLDESQIIRFPSGAGIAGSVFTNGKTINIDDAYADSRFNQAVDKKTGYRTHTILCQQVHTKKGKPIGVIQVLNKKDAAGDIEDMAFDAADERNLRAFTAQAAVALENAQLFEEVMTVKNFNEAVLQSMANGLVTVDAFGRMTKANRAALGVLRLGEIHEVVGKTLEELFVDENAWAAEMVRKVISEGGEDSNLDTLLLMKADAEEPEYLNCNFSAQPLMNAKEEGIGALVVIEDITSEKRLKSTMARYMPKEVADRLLEGGESALGGALQETTILFSDIRSFTSLSEQVGPVETVQMLNEYFSIMVDEIMSNNGILDKYIGDAIMAVFGAPFTSGQDADNGLTSALNMHMALGHFNQLRRMENKFPIEIGIGLNTGEVVCGNIGSSRRMDYTVIGDGVNLAARLESATKTYGAKILISESTVSNLRKGYVLREVDLLRVKGKTKPVAVYEALDWTAAYPEQAFPNRDGVLHHFHIGTEYYKGRAFEQARESFKRALQLHPGDRVAKLYFDRCAAFITNPPEPDWDGVWVMKTK
jgi:adenylate cyclase